MRMDALRSYGRRVVLVGDYNIAPSAIDSCDPGTGAEYTAWLTRRDRAFLRSHLHEHGGAYTDIFRTFHADRCEGYDSFEIQLSTDPWYAVPLQLACCDTLHPSLCGVVCILHSGHMSTCLCIQPCQVQGHTTKHVCGRPSILTIFLALATPTCLPCLAGRMHTHAGIRPLAPVSTTMEPA